MTSLSALGARHEIVGDVRGMGLFATLDLAAERGTRTHLHKARAQPFAALRRGLRERDVYIWHDELVIAPPPTITEAQSGEATEAIDGGLDKAAAAP